MTPPRAGRPEGRPRLARTLAAATVAAAFALSACSGGGAPSTTQAPAAGGGGGGNSGYTFAMITHETPGDTFW